MAKCSVLKLKMLRDIRKNLSQFITIFLMLLIGMMAYSGIRAYMNGMEISASNYYKENNLQDLDAFGKLDDNTIANLKNIKHVRDTEGKLTLPSEVKNLESRSLQLNFIASNKISQFYVLNGEAFNKNKSGIWLDEYFARNNNLKLGDTLSLKTNDLELNEKIIGLIYTPDHVGYVKDSTEIFPTHDRYGYAYLSQNELPKTMRFYSSAMIDVDDENNIKDVKTAISKTIDNVASVVYTKDQYSAASYQGEINEGKTYVGILSSLFIVIALLCVVTTMTRIIRKDRMQIGAMKALGFSDGRIMWHYLSYIFLIAIFSTSTGLLLGHFWFGNFFLDMQMSYFEIANYHSITNWDTLLVMALSIASACTACYLTIRNYVNQPAAEILRVERPNPNSRNLRFTTSKFFNKLPFSTRWNIRDIIRNKIRATTGVVGIVGCMVLLVCGFGIKDTMNNYLNTELNIINNYKYRLNIAEDADPKHISELMDQYSQNSSKTLTVEVKTANDLKLNSVFINDSNNAVRTLDKDWQPMTIPENGIIITQKLAENEGFKLGEEIEWRIVGEKTFFRTKIVGMNRDPQNQNITMTRNFYESLGRKYSPDAIYTNTEITNLPKGTVSIQGIKEIRDGVNTMLNTMMRMIILLVIFATLLGAIIIYNLGILSFTEKDYQFSTLKVLGFSDRKISHIFIEQNLWLTIVAIVVGLPLGYLLTNFIFKKAIENSYDFSVFVTLPTCLISVLGTLLVSLTVSSWLTRRVVKIDMVKSLKANE